ncbi:MAG: hypothetical protein J5779_03345 [Clostridia bacterium]|nr:hypothetical protein [Clostridia bacterium]
MSTIYPDGAFITIDFETVLAGAMKANEKLEVSYDEIKKMQNFFNKKLEETETLGYAKFDSESIKEIKQYNKSFFIGENFVNCVDGWKKVEEILSYCDVNTLLFIFEYQDIINSKKNNKGLDK